MGPGWGQNLEALQENLPGVQACEGMDACAEGMDACGEVELKARVQAGTITQEERWKVLGFQASAGQDTGAAAASPSPDYVDYVERV